ncbi:hypothetical protein ACRYCC_24330 [Actinomadura scrupuli]|uniref:hypothetical protein n=1 Tax=Actinomadura scrupuli TaxID=559629 RepID=UPI003D96180F
MTRLLLVWLWLPALVGLTWSIGRVVMPGYGIDRVVAHWVQRTFLPHGGLSGAAGWFWLWVASVLLLTGLLIGFDEDFDFGSGLTGRLAFGTAVVTIVAALVVVVWPLPSALWDNDKDAGRYYNRTTVFHVPTLTDPPGSVADLVTGSRPGGPGCDRIGRHDVPSCIKVDNAYPAMRWESRTSSLASARTAMTQAASPVQGVDVMSDSLTYIWGAAPNTGQWSAILDGSGSSRPAYGVAQFDGATNSTQVCRFTGDHRFDRAFNGTKMNDLKHLLAERHPELGFEDKDVWGYCQGDRPVIVVVVQRQIAYKNRTVRVAAGVLLLKGSRDGAPDITYRPKVAPGELPGPVYPITLTRVQRDATAWAAGRKSKKRSFGFRTSDFSTQKANPGEYLLRGTDHRLYYVTPLIPRGTKSQSFVAYGIVSADQVDSGRLNRYDVYTLATGDPLIANLNSLNAKAVPFIQQTGAQLEQFIPLGADRWRVYGVRDGQTVFYIDLSSTDQIQPKAVAPGGSEVLAPGTAPSGPSAPSAPGKPTDCGAAPAKMNDKQLARCLAGLADELRRRNGGG